MIASKSISIFACAWGNEVPLTKQVLEHCMKVFPYFDDFIFKQDIDNLLDYNKFMVEGLNDFIKTDFVLTVQPDGFILHPNLWKNRFLNFDYIGAPWPWHGTCGNGGFSLRSKKFLDLSSKLKYTPDHQQYKMCPEDNFLCLEKYNRNYFIKNDVKFADVETALEFSFEHPVFMYPNHSILQSFGFHGKHLVSVK